MNIDDVLDLKRELKEKSAHPEWAERVLGHPPTETRTVTTPGAGQVEMEVTHPEAEALAEIAESAHTRPTHAVNYSMGVAWGKRRDTYGLAVRIHAEGEEAARLEEHVKQTASGKADVDVRIIPRIAKRPMANPPGKGWVQSKQRPLKSGLSVGCLDVHAGTIGLVLDDLAGPAILSNNHILADVNKAQPGMAIIQPGPIDAGNDPLQMASLLVAVLDRYVPISFIRANLVDAALSQIVQNVDHELLTSEAMDAGDQIKGFKPVTIDDLGRKVWKIGRGTGFTEGKITAVSADSVKVDMGEPNKPAVALFSDQFEVRNVDDGKPFSQDGDSGSLIVDEDHFARGLLFAGGADTTGVDHTYANRMDHVVKLLGLDLAKGS